MAAWYDLRVFCTEGQGGNPLAVVTEPVEDMAGMAASIGYSETVFLGEPPKSRLVPQALRIFAPAQEILFAGHPLVGAAWLAEELSGKPIERLAPPFGEVEAWRDGAGAYVRTEPPDLIAGPEDPFAVVDALRADPIDLTPRLPLALCGHGPSWLIVPFAEPARVLELDPDFDAVREVAVNGLYCFAMRGGNVTARCFAPGLGVPEDLGTGSAAIALAAYLARYRRRPPSEMTISQTTCRINVMVDERGIAIGGEVVLVGVRG